LRCQKAWQEKCEIDEPQELQTCPVSRRLRLFLG